MDGNTGPPRTGEPSERRVTWPKKRHAPYADIAPALDEYTREVLFGDVGKRPGLSPRDRSLVTVAALVALYRPNELPFHLGRALGNGVTKDELIELITHLAFYGGWPAATTAVSPEEGVRRSPGLTNRPRPAGAFHASLGEQPLWSEPLFE